MLEQPFKQLGLGDHEATVYATLLQNSPASASLLAKKTGLSRSSVYTTISILTSKGLVGTTYKNEVKQFVAEGYSALQNLVEEQKRQAQDQEKVLASIKTKIEGLVGPSINIPQVISFEGKEGLKRIYSAMLRQASESATLYILRDEFVWQEEWKFIFER